MENFDVIVENMDDVLIAGLINFVWEQLTPLTNVVENRGGTNPIEY